MMQVPLLNQASLQNAEGNMHDPITYKPFTEHTHIVFLRPTVSVFHTPY